MDYDAITIKYCGCCAVTIMTDRSRDSQRHEFFLEELTVLELEEEDIVKWRNSEEDIQKLRSVFRLGSGLDEKFYNVLPNAVFQDWNNKYKIHACDTCFYSLRSRQRPKLSIRNGYDFGCVSNTSLPELSLAEKALIGLNRVYGDIVKLRPAQNLSDETRLTALKGHVITIPHKGAQMACTELPRMRADDVVSIYFIGAASQWHRLRRDWKRVPLIKDKLQVRPAVVMRWLSVLQKVNPYYEHLDIRPLTVDLERDLENIPEVILSNAYVTEDEETFRLDSNTSRSTANIVPDNGAHLENVEENVTVEEQKESQIIEQLTNRILDIVMLQDDDAINPVNGSEELEVLKALQDKLKDITGRTVESSDGEPRTLAIPRGTQLFTEFGKNNELLYGAFPWLFPFGTGIPSLGTLPPTLTRHFLSHYNDAFGRDHKLIFLLFNQMQRHAAITRTKAALYSDKKNVRNLINTLNAPTFDRDLADAIKDPISDHGKKFTRKILSYMRMGGSSVKFGDMERKVSTVRLATINYTYSLYVM
jgi:hypothetical protein